MKLKTGEAPDSYSSTEVVAVIGIEGEEDLVKVNRCKTEKDQIFYHVSHEPQDISDPEDIETVHSYKVSFGTPEPHTRTNAIMAAERYYRKNIVQ